MAMKMDMEVPSDPSLPTLFSFVHLFLTVDSAVLAELYIPLARGPER